MRDWEITSPLKRGALDFERYPEAEVLGDARWTKVSASPSGLVDISRTHGRTGPETDAIVARAVIHSDRAGARRFRFGYSDEVSLFMNGAPVF